MNTENAKPQNLPWMTDMSGAIAWHGDDFVVNQVADFDKAQRILVVDDEPDIVDEMKDFLENKGYVCETAYSAQGALEKLANVPEISIVLTDVRMPGMSGLELLSTLRKPPYMERQIEVIVLTGHAGRDEAIQALHNGAIDFLIKPVSLKKVQFAVIRAQEVLRTRFMEGVTRLKMLEALEEERCTSQLQREFVAMISHELRTPLAIIDGTAQRLIRRQDQVTGEEVVERAGRIRAAVSRMTDLIEDTLCAARLDAGNLKFTPTPCPLVDLIKTVCHHQQDLNPGRQIKFDPGTLPETIVADCGLLEQIFVNLVANAIKYSPNGAPVEVVGGRKGDFTTITVLDQGIGIPAEDLPRLFERYFRADNTTGIPGTGIGLNLVKHLVEMHGGSINAQSVEGEGTTITVSIPNAVSARSQDVAKGDQSECLVDGAIALPEKAGG